MSDLSPEQLQQQIQQLQQQLQTANSQNQQLASQVANLQQDAQRFEGIDPDQYRQQNQTLTQQLETQSTQLAQLQQQLQQQTQAAQAGTLRTHAVEGLYQAGVRSQYRELMQDRVVGELGLNDQGQIQLPDGVADANAYYQGLRQRYPDCFAPDHQGEGSGSNPPNTAGGNDNPAVTTVKAEGGVISGVNPRDVIAGKVSIER